MLHPTALLSAPAVPNTTLLNSDVRTVEPAGVAAPFDLDVRTVELAGVATQINLTDDNCGGTCSGTACNSAV